MKFELKKHLASLMEEKNGYQVDLHVGELANTYNLMGEKMGEKTKNYLILHIKSPREIEPGLEEHFANSKRRLHAQK
jgi:hypothetical protein